MQGVTTTYNNATMMLELQVVDNFGSRICIADHNHDIHSTTLNIYVMFTSLPTNPSQGVHRAVQSFQNFNNNEPILLQSIMGVGFTDPPPFVISETPRGASLVPNFSESTNRQ